MKENSEIKISKLNQLKELLFMCLTPLKIIILLKNCAVPEIVYALLRRPNILTASLWKLDLDDVSVLFYFPFA